VTFNLDHLKQELLDYIEAEGFAVFRCQPGSLESVPTIYWDSESFPDYKSFLRVAKVSEARIVVFADREFEATEIDDALEQLEDCEFGRDEHRSIERNLTDLRAFAGRTCSLEIAFDYKSRMYVFELVTDWFQTFLDLSELLMAAASTGNDDEEEEEGGSDSSFGGYYSKN
jgi:hypothetical protein